MLTIEEYFDMLGRHDWFYEYSDDHGVWQNGQATKVKLQSLAKTNDQFAIMFADYNSYINAVISEGPYQETVPLPKLEDYV